MNLIVFVLMDIEMKAIKFVRKYLIVIILVIYVMIQTIKIYALIVSLIDI